MVNVSRIQKKLGELEIYVEGLLDKQGISRKEYLDDRDTQDIVERRFEKAIQASLDIVSHIVSSENFREPENYGDLFEILREREILSETISEQMVEMAGFRNVLAHEYSDIRNERVYAHLQNLDRFRDFASEVHNYVSKKND